MTDIDLYKELIAFCNANQGKIESKFQRDLEFTDFNALCYREMYEKCRNIENPLPVKYFKGIIPGLTEAYKTNAVRFVNKRNESIKGFDIQKGNWYERALELFLKQKGIVLKKTKFPCPDMKVFINDRPVAYFELKYINSPFVYACSKIKNTYPYTSPRYDYEASLTLDTGKKMAKQREKSEELIKEGFMVHYVWWYDCFHIKGIFAMPAKEVFDYYDHIGGDLHVRKERDGDKIAHQEIGKIYPPLLEMMPFTEYINLIKNI